MGPLKVDNRQLQTGTGTAHSTAISAAITATVIFSLVDKSMAPSERDPSLPTYNRIQGPSQRPTAGQASRALAGSLVWGANRPRKPRV
jgi:hypothetical protein